MDFEIICGVQPEILNMPTLWAKHEYIYFWDADCIHCLPIVVILEKSDGDTSTQGPFTKTLVIQ